METDITAQNRSYRRGLVLGLTMAEIAILVIFSLLLAIGALLSSKDQEIEQLTSEAEEAHSEAKELGTQIRELATAADISENNFDDLFVDLTLKIREVKDHQDSIAPLEERSNQLHEFEDVIHKYNSPRGERKSQEKVEWLDAQLSIARTAQEVVEGRLDSTEDLKEKRQRVEEELFALQQFQDAIQTATEEIGRSRQSLIVRCTQTLSCKKKMRIYKANYGTPSAALAKARNIRPAGQPVPVSRSISSILLLRCRNYRGRQCVTESCQDSEKTAATTDYF